MRRFLRHLLLCGSGLFAMSNAFVQPTTLLLRKINPVNISLKRAEVGHLQKHSHRITPARKLLNGNGDDDKEVNVNLIPNVDAFSLTAIGFGLIAFNFFVLANMGDAGLAGIVARIINTIN